MLINNLQECKKFFREYRFVRDTAKKYFEYEKNHSLNEIDRDISNKVYDEFLSMAKTVKFFIDSIEDNYIKQIFCMRYLSGYPWQKVSMFFGGVASADCYRNACDRYLRKFFESLNVNKK